MIEQASQAMAAAQQQLNQAMAPEPSPEPQSRISALEEELAAAKQELKQQRTTALPDLESVAVTDSVANPFESMVGNPFLLEKPTEISSETKGDKLAECSIPQTLVPPEMGRLPQGLKCLYYSSSHSTRMPAIVEGFNDSDCTYDLNVRKHAALERISPCHNVPKSEAWPKGTRVSYE